MKNFKHQTHQKEKNVIVTIKRLGINGEGIGYYKKKIIFIPGALPGEVVVAKIVKDYPHYLQGELVRIKEKSPDRVKFPKDVNPEIGGLELAHLAYDKQLEFKKDNVVEALKKYHPRGYAKYKIKNTIPAPDQWHYRNKAQYPVGYDRVGNLVVGFYAGRTHDIIANTDCPLGPPENQAILDAVLSYMRENDVSAYRESTGEGLVRHVLIRTGFASGEIMVCLVINGKKLPAEEKLVEKLTEIDLKGGSAGEAVSADGGGNFTDSGGQSAARDELSDNVYGQTARDEGRGTPRKRIVSISVSINREKTNVIMGHEIRVLWGSGWIEDSLRVLNSADFGRAGLVDDECTESEERITFRISPLSFYQVNPRQTEKLYSLALEYAGLTGQETVWDLYCGIGTISLFMAKRARKVYGVEVIPQAVEDAKENARRNEITNVEFFAGKAEEVLPGFYKGNSGSNSLETVDVSADKQMRHPDVIVVDPPRKGCDEKCMETMLAMQPERIVYVSCDPATLARDLKVLCGGGYELRRVRAVDQFGQTGHVEVIIMMQYCGKEKN